MSRDTRALHSHPYRRSLTQGEGSIKQGPREATGAVHNLLGLSAKSHEEARFGRKCLADSHEALRVRQALL